MQVTLLDFENWSSNLGAMVVFHQEQNLPWLWLPTPTDWLETLLSKDETMAMELRSTLVRPTLTLPPGLDWHAWDTRTDGWVRDSELLKRWYSVWKDKQSAVL